jgi:hypothetical protein
LEFNERTKERLPAEIAERMSARNGKGGQLQAPNHQPLQRTTRSRQEIELVKIRPVICAWLFV